MFLPVGKEKFMIERFLTTYGIIMLYIFGVGSVFVVTASLRELTSPALKIYRNWTLFGILFFSISSFLAYTARNETIFPLFQGLLFCFLPLVTLCFWICLLAELPSLRYLPDKTNRLFLTFFAGMGIIWSPILGTSGIGETCNKIHQW